MSFPAPPYDEKWYRSLFQTIPSRNYSALDKVLNDPELDVNFINNRGHSLLTTAITYVDKFAVDRLLAHPDIDVNLRNHEHFTPLTQIARYRGNEHFVKLDVIHIVQSLIDAGADLNAVDDQGYSAITHAINNHNIDVIKTLMMAGADLRVANSYKYLKKLSAVDPTWFEINKDVRRQKLRQISKDVADKIGRLDQGSNKPVRRRPSPKF